ncbi:MAG: hypothetical protein WD767_03825 [Alphaproteobacteria bacterium]
MTAAFKDCSIVQHRYKAWVSGSLAVLLICNVEMIWVTIYHSVSGGDAAAIARGVTKALFIVRLPAELAFPLGVAAETGLAILFGSTVYYAVSLLPRRTVSTVSRSVIAVALLVFIWIMNFYIALPLINPAVDATIPHALSLTFYAFFGSVAVLAIRFFDASRHDRTITHETAAAHAAESAKKPCLTA